MKVGLMYVQRMIPLITILVQYRARPKKCRSYISK